MKVILKDFVNGFGEKNDIVIVKNGYGRNFLIPQGLATIATPSAIKMAEENVRQAAHKQAKIVANAKIEIDNQRKAAVNDIKNQAGVMAIEIAESLIKKNLKGDAEQEDLVNTLVDKFNLN